MSAAKKGSRGERRSGAVERERALFVDIVGTEISAIWRNVTRLGGQCVAALYLRAEPRTMDDLVEELGRSKSNVFSNLRALEQLGIVRRTRPPGSAKDHFELSGDYPDVLVVAFARHLSHTLRDKSTELTALAERLGGLAHDGPTRAMVSRVSRVAETYGAAGRLIDALLPRAGESGDIVSVLRRITPTRLKDAVKVIAKRGTRSGGKA